MLQTPFGRFLHRVTMVVGSVIYTMLGGFLLLIVIVPVVSNIRRYTEWQLELTLFQLWIIGLVILFPLLLLVRIVTPAIIWCLSLFGKLWNTLFPPKVHFCAKCGKASTLIHGYSNSHTNDESLLQVCTDCFTRLIDTDLQKHPQPIVFTEPLMEEHYGFASFKSEYKSDEKLIESIKTYMPNQSAVCQICAKSASYVWLPNDAVVEGRTAMAFYPKGKYRGSTEYCREHLVAQLRSNILERQFPIYTFQTLRSDLSGYFF